MRDELPSHEPVPAMESRRATGGWIVSIADFRSGPPMGELIKAYKGSGFSDRLRSKGFIPS
jgi:hypothetical protein